MTPSGDQPGSRTLPEIEFAARLARVQQAMDANRIGALVLTAQDNFVYLTGFDSPTWVNLARPRYCVLPLHGAPILIVPTTNVSAAERMTWIKDIRSWVSPNPADDGLSLVLDAIATTTAPNAEIGMEIGPQSRLGLPAVDFLSLRERLLPRRTVDADVLLREIRKVKSPFEISAIRKAATATSHAFGRLPEHLRAGRSDHDVIRDFRALLFAAGVEEAPYLVIEGGIGGYPSLQMGASDRRIEAGTVLGIDAGCRVNGYFCDFNRNFAFGAIPDVTRRADDLLWQATQAGIDAARPAATAGDIWRAMARILDRGLEGIGGRRSRSGRMGHGIGLRLTEPPSVHPDDATPLVPGMVIAIEPSVEFEVPTEDGTLRQMLIHEENIVVTENGAEILSARAVRGLPHIA